MAELPLVLTVEEAAELLRIGRGAAYEAARRGQLPTIRIGRSLRVPRHALEGMLGLGNDSRPADRPAAVTTHAEAGGGDERSG